jgi:inner membrane protein
MDPIAHTLVGAALAQTGLGRKTAYGTAALVIGANLPDIDGVSMFTGFDPSLLFRRGWTHGILALVLLPLVLTGLLVLWNRLKASSPDGPRLRTGVLLGLSYFAIATHPTLDWLNNYGMRWLMPFEDRWYYGDTLFITDPWIWLMLGGAVFLFRSRSVASLAAWATLAGLWLLLLFGLPELWPAKFLWCTGLIVFIVLRVRRVGHGELAASRLAVGATAIVFLYIVAMYGTARYARSATEKNLADRGIRVESVMMGPVPVTPFVKDVVAQTPGGYRYGKARLFPRFELELAPQTLPLLEDSPVVQKAIASPSVRGFMNWARFPFADVEESTSGFTVYLLDARYTRSRTVGFGAARVEISKDQLE